MGQGLSNGRTFLVLMWLGSSIDFHGPANRENRLMEPMIRYRHLANKLDRYCYYCEERLVEIEIVMVNGRAKKVCERCKTQSERIDHLTDDLYEQEMDRRVDMERKEG